MSAPAEDPSDPLGLIGTLLDERYKIERLIGRGGMGFVYEAQHTRIQRAVAVKVLSQLQARRRFEREALTTARIDHKNSVRLTDFGNLEDGTMFLVMELLEGVSLASVVDDGGPIDSDRALRICRDVLSALAHAHKQGVVHRDIKPENIYLCRDDDGEEMAKVLDFGIAKLISDATASGDDEKLTEVGMAIGTPTYMSPEQGFGSGIDGRSDVYSMSVVLFEMLTGKPPFRADTPLDTLRMHIAQPPPTLESRNPALASPALEALVARGLAKKSDDRIPSAEAFIDSIDAILESAASSAAGGVDTAAASVPPAAGSSRPATPRPSPSLEMAAAVSSTAPIAAVSLAPPPSTASPTVSLSGQARAPRPLWRHPRVLTAVAIAATVVLFLVIVSAGSSGTDSPASAQALKWIPVEAPPPPLPALSPLAEKASALIDDSKERAAIELLKGDPSGADDAGAQLVLGHAYAASDQASAAIKAYTVALESERAFGSEPTLVANLKRYLESRRRSTAAAALECLAVAAEARSNKEARAALADVASSHPRRTIRGRAVELAESLGVDNIDELSLYTLELQQGRTCKDRLEAVNKLREIGDKAALPSLHKARRRMGGGFLGIGKKNINACLREDLEAAIAELENS